MRSLKNIMLTAEFSDILQTRLIFENGEYYDVPGHITPELNIRLKEAPEYNDSKLLEALFQLTKDLQFISDDCDLMPHTSTIIALGNTIDYISKVTSEYLGIEEKIQKVRKDI